ncbi:MAG: efflux RND transporter periplasmic adaptor subunit, partial [Sediminibacterium sp.]|nr:efflux RND transporter periplasmic adaptor subunit [Sediminibacterium sp.]
MRKLNLIAFILMLGLFACKEKTKPTDKFNANAPVSVDIAIAAAQVVDKVIEVNGSVVASEFVDIRPESNGRIVFLQIPEGKMVTAGTVLAKLNDADLQAQLQKIKVQLALANINEQRNLKLVQAKGINQSDYEISLQQVNGLKADMVYTQSLIDKTVIKAPFSGQMGLRQVSLGANINTASTIVTLQKVDQLKVDFTLPEIYQNYIKVGKKVTVESIANPGVKMTATIAAIEPQIIATSRNIKVRANLQGKLLPGAYTKVFLGENQQKPSILVPSNIIIPDSKVKQLVVVREGKAKFINVETGYRTAAGVEITSGVKVGDTLIVAGMLFVRDGSELKIGKTLPLA